MWNSNILGEEKEEKGQTLIFGNEIFAHRNEQAAYYVATNSKFFQN